MLTVFAVTQSMGQSKKKQGHFCGERAAERILQVQDLQQIQQALANNLAQARAALNEARKFATEVSFVPEDPYANVERALNPPTNLKFCSVLIDITIMDRLEEALQNWQSANVRIDQMRNTLKEKRTKSWISQSAKIKIDGNLTILEPYTEKNAEATANLRRDLDHPDYKYKSPGYLKIRELPTPADEDVCAKTRSTQEDIVARIDALAVQNSDTEAAINEIGEILSAIYAKIVCK